MGRFRDYDAIKAMSNSMLSHFKRSPAHYIQALKDGFPQTPALTFGIAAHSYILEPQNFRKDIFVMDETKRPVADKNYQTHANADWKRAIFAEALKNGQEVITAAEFEIIKQMEEVVRRHELAGELLAMSGNKFESKAEWNWKGTRCKSLRDITNPHFLADYKTSADADPDTFLRKSFFNYDYHRQSGMYLDGDSEGKIKYENAYKDFFFIVQEKVPPYAVAVYKVRKEVLNRGIEEYRSLVEQFQSCMDHKIWQGYEFKSIGGQMFEVDLPYYMRD